MPVVNIGRCLGICVMDPKEFSQGITVMKKTPRQSINNKFGILVKEMIRCCLIGVSAAV